MLIRTATSSGSFPIQYEVAAHRVRSAHIPAGKQYRRKKMKAAIRVSKFAQQGMMLLLLAMVVVVPLLFSSQSNAWRSVRPIVLELAVVALVGLALIQASVPNSARRVWEFLRSGPTQPILILLFYGAISWFYSPAPEFSAPEWLRLASGAGLYLVVLAALRRRDQIRATVQGLLGVALLTSLYGLGTFGQRHETSMSSSFGNGQLFSGFLLLLLPLLLAIACGDSSPVRKILAQAGTAAAIPALLLTQTRSSWVGVLFALGTLALLAWRYTNAGRNFMGQKHQMVVPLAIVVGALGLFLFASRSTPMLAARAKTLAHASQDASFAWRLEMWQGAWKLIRERPLFGWGIGTFPLEHSRVVPGAAPRDFVRRTGPTLAEEAHNEYLQIGAELGLLGVGLYLWILGAFFQTGLRALRHREGGFRQLVLLGSLAGVAGQVVDALSNPAWRFADVSFLFWLTLGLGMAVARTLRSEPATEAAAEFVPERGRVRLGWQAAAVVLTMLAMNGAWARRGFCPLPAYNGPVELRLEPARIALRPGECARFRLFASTNNSSFVDVTDSSEARIFIKPGDERCLLGPITFDSRPQVTEFCAAADACSTPACGQGRTVPVFAILGSPNVQIHSLVTIACP
jgi:O-antigen ligase